MARASLLPSALSANWVVECPAKYGDVLVEELKSATKLNNLSVLHHHRDASGTTSFVVAGDVTEIAYLSAIFVSVPSTAQRPLADLSYDYVDLTAEPNEVVARLVAQISQTELQANVDKLSSFFTRLSTSTVVVEAQQWLEQHLASLGLQVSTFPFRAGYSSNVIGELKGVEDPDKVIIISAHYDSRTTTFNANLRAPGADDNGSGSANVIEIARVFTQSQIKFKYTVRFCLWSGEEQGLIGSRAYAAKMRRDGEDILAVLNGDMLGWTLPRTNITVGMSNRYVSVPLNNVVNDITRTYVPSIGIGPTSACCSDHQSFFENGFPAVGYAENTGLYTDYPYYHRSNDLPEFLNFVQITLISQAIAAAAATLAVPIEN